MQTVKLIPMRMIFNNPESNFSIISCRTKDDSIERHPQYGTINLKGTGIADLKMGQSIDCIIEPCEDDKYKYSYKFIGFAGFVAKDGKFNLTEKAELQTLRNLMTNGQAESCHVAYPHFVSMVLNGEEAKLDYKKIRGVGKVLLPRYIDKIKTNNKRVEFMGETYAWGIEHDEDINKIAATYKNVYEFSKDISANPYAVMINLLEWSFDRADRAITNKTAIWLNSYERCEAATIYALKHNELDGNTRMQAKQLFDMVKQKAPQCVHHLLDVVTKSAQVHYDPPSQNTALQATYSAEQYIADVIKKKIANPHYYPMDWQKFTSVDGLELTDEQSQILEMACKQDVMMLTAAGGCGKTTSVKAVIEMLEANNYTYTLLAPTGISSKRLREATDREAQTIHMFLTMGDNVGDYLICDECSMCSVHLLQKPYHHQQAA
jgi:exodeoxyribonuclease V alpha subunit